MVGPSSSTSIRQSLSAFVVLLCILTGFYINSKNTNTNTQPSEMSKVAKDFVPRAIYKSFLAVEQSEGVGARVRRSIGTLNVRNFTPFLMLDHLTKAGGGFPDHPHRGQETVTYVLKGAVDHEDFTGSKGTIHAGDLQFMTAGKGIVHAEMFNQEVKETPEIMQLWVDLPAELKECEPRYRDLKAEEIPVAKPNDKVEVKVIAGESYGVKSVQDLAYTPMCMYDYKVQPGGVVRQEVPEGWNTFLYVLHGGINVNGKKIDQFNTVLFKPNGDGVEFAVPEDGSETRVVLYGGQILDQEIVQHGPFVETSRDRIVKAFMDYQTGQNGFERASNWSSEIGKRKIF